MADFPFYFALILCLFSAGVWLVLFTGAGRVRYLRDIPAAEDLAYPKVSIIVPARNEEREIEGALQSLLSLDYPDYEIMVVNDRSTDGTGEILARMQTRYPQLTVATVTELPPGWLGKNHAMNYGAERATGEILLFTDADIVMRPDTLRRAVTYLEREQLDFLPMTPQTEMPNWLLQGFITIFVILFTLHTQPWNVRNKKSTAHVGIGAFNLIRARVYRAIGTHAAIAMRPDDDLKLGKLAKKNGFACDLVHGQDFISVKWYASLRELIHGLEKNTFSGVDYSITMTLVSSILMLVVNVWPFVAVFLYRGPTQWLYLATVAMHSASFLATARQIRVPLWTVITYPLVFTLFVYIQWRTMLLNHWLGGIRWRDTLYPLAELKANKV